MLSFRCFALDDVLLLSGVLFPRVCVCLRTCCTFWCVVAFGCALPAAVFAFGRVSSVHCLRACLPLGVFRACFACGGVFAFVRAACCGLQPCICLRVVCRSSFGSAVFLRPAEQRDDDECPDSSHHNPASVCLRTFFRTLGTAVETFLFLNFLFAPVNPGSRLHLSREWRVVSLRFDFEVLAFFVCFVAVVLEVFLNLISS